MLTERGLQTWLVDRSAIAWRLDFFKERERDDGDGDGASFEPQGFQHSVRRRFLRQFRLYDSALFVRLTPSSAHVRRRRSSRVAIGSPTRYGDGESPPGKIRTSG
jgi:hypothetical protein